MECKKPTMPIPEIVSIEHNFETKTSVAVFKFFSAERQYTKEDGIVPAVPMTHVRLHLDWSECPEIVLADLVVSAMKISPMVRRPVHEALASDPLVREFWVKMNAATMTRKAVRKSADKTPTADEMLAAVKSGKVDKAALLALLATLE